MNFQNLLARRTQGMHVNAIREILKVASQPGMISLAGGIPAPESFPLELIAELNGRVLATYAADALQYGLTEGFPPPCGRHWRNGCRPKTFRWDPKRF